VPRAKADHIEILNKSTETRDLFELHVGGGLRASVTKREGLVEVHWEVFGPQYWPQAKVLMQGLLELSVVADQLSGGKVIEE